MNVCHLLPLLLLISNLMLSEASAILTTLNTPSTSGGDNEFAVERKTSPDMQQVDEAPQTGRLPTDPDLNENDSSLYKVMKYDTHKRKTPASVHIEPRELVVEKTDLSSTNHYQVKFPKVVEAAVDRRTSTVAVKTFSATSEGSNGLTDLNDSPLMSSNGGQTLDTLLRRSSDVQEHSSTKDEESQWEKHAEVKNNFENSKLKVKSRIIFDSFINIFDESNTQERSTSKAPSSSYTDFTYNAASDRKLNININSEMFQDSPHSVATPTVPSGADLALGTTVPSTVANSSEAKSTMIPIVEVTIPKTESLTQKTLQRYLRRGTEAAESLFNQTLSNTSTTISTEPNSSKNTVVNSQIIPKNSPHYFNEHVTASAPLSHSTQQDSPHHVNKHSTASALLSHSTQQDSSHHVNEHVTASAPLSCSTPQNSPHHVNEHVTASTLLSESNSQADNVLNDYTFPLTESSQIVNTKQVFKPRAVSVFESKSSDSVIDISTHPVSSTNPPVVQDKSSTMKYGGREQQVHSGSMWTIFTTTSRTHSVLVQGVQTSYTHADVSKYHVNDQVSQGGPVYNSLQITSITSTTMSYSRQSTESTAQSLEQSSPSIASDGLIQYGSSGQPHSITNAEKLAHYDNAINLKISTQETTISEPYIGTNKYDVQQKQGMESSANDVTPKMPHPADHYPVPPQPSSEPKTDVDVHQAFSGVNSNNLDGSSNHGHEEVIRQLPTLQPLYGSYSKQADIKGDSDLAVISQKHRLGVTSVLYSAAKTNVGNHDQQVHSMERSLDVTNYNKIEEPVEGTLLSVPAEEHVQFVTSTDQHGDVNRGTTLRPDSGEIVEVSEDEIMRAMSAMNDRFGGDARAAIIAPRRRKKQKGRMVGGVYRERV